MNETNFKCFIMIIESAGFVDSRLVRAMNPLNFAYTLHLKLRSEKYARNRIEKLVRRWFVLTLLTQRYSGSPESSFDQDIKCDGRPFKEYLEQIEEAELSDAFWNVGLIRALSTSNVSHPSFSVFLAAQVKLNDRGFLSKEITVRTMLEHKGDIHHVFPKAFLKRKRLTRARYNQVANYVYVQSETNIAIGDAPPSKYLSIVVEQCETKQAKLGGITEFDDLHRNLTESCLPVELLDGSFSDYDEFLELRRKLMADKIRRYYDSL